MAEVIARKSVIAEYIADTSNLEKGTEQANRATLRMRDIGTKTQEAIKKGYQETAVAAKSASTEIDRVSNSLKTQQAAQKDLAKQIAEQNKITAEFKAELVEVEAEMKNVKRFSQDYAVLTERQKQLTAAIKDNVTAVRGLRAQKQIVDANVNALKEEEKAIKANQAATGEATTAKQRFSALLQAVGINVGGVTGRVGNLITALKGLRIALIQTGIGAIVVVIGTLVAAFLSTQRGADALTRVLTPLKTAFQTLFGTVQQLGTLLADLFSDPANTLANFGSRIREIGKSASDALREGASRGKEIADIAIELERLEAQRSVTLARINRQISEQQLIARNTAKSDKERKAAVDEILRLTQQEADVDLQINRLKQRKLQLEQASNDTGRLGAGSQKELNDLKAEEIALEDSVLERKRELVRVTSGIQKRAQVEILTGIAKYREELQKAVKTLEGLSPGTKQFNDQAKAVRELRVEVTGLEKALEDALRVPERSEFVKIAEGGIRTLERRLEGLQQAAREALLGQDQALLDQLRRSIESIQAEIQAYKARNGDVSALDQIIGTNQQAQKSRQSQIESAINNLRQISAKPITPEGTAAREKRLNEQRIQQLGDLKEAASNTFSALSDLNNQQLEEIQTLVTAQSERVSRYERLAETGSARQLEIEEERLTKLQAIQAKAQQQQRQLAQAQIATSQAVTAAEAVKAITQAFAQGGPLGILTGVATSAALALAIASTIKSVSGAFSNLPAFREGTESVKGPGTGRSDSILARVSRGERITDAVTNGKIAKAANGIFPNHLLPEAVQAYMGMPALSAGLAQMASVTDRGLSRLTEEVAGLRKEQKETRIFFGIRDRQLAAMVSQYEIRDRWIRG